MNKPARHITTSSQHQQLHAPIRDPTPCLHHLLVTASRVPKRAQSWEGSTRATSTLNQPTGKSHEKQHHLDQKTHFEVGASTYERSRSQAASTPPKIRINKRTIKMEEDEGGDVRKVTARNEGERERERAYPCPSPRHQGDDDDQVHEAPVDQDVGEELPIRKAAPAAKHRQHSTRERTTTSARNKRPNDVQGIKREKQQQQQQQQQQEQQVQRL